jgi:RHS repeat-associated protein
MLVRGDHLMRRRLAGLATSSMWLWLLSVITCSLATEANAANAPPAMIVPGQFNVSATGAATYNIPIAVPPGSAGMVPALSLGYSSQSGNGIEGIGWTLSGLPSISRCPRTLAQDSVHGSVNYDTNDRFCMEGQRLIYVSGGSGYGTDGSQYRTEVESFSEIIEHNAINSSNVWFEVHTKSGQIMQLGNTTDSQILTVGLTSGNVVRAWAVNQITDTVGNYLTVTYNCTPVSGACTDGDRTTYGEAYPLQINYTGNVAAGVSPYNSVTFSYQCRDGAGTCRGDTVPMYQAGASTQTTVLLTDIKTYQGANLVYDYQLAYREGTSTTNSRLTSVTLCDNASHCLAPTTFGWQGGGSALSMSSTVNTIGSGSSLLPGDFNGDGLTDVAIINGSSCSDFPLYFAPNFSTPSSTLPNPGSGILTTCANEVVPITLAPNGIANTLIVTNGTQSGGAQSGFIQFTIGNQGLSPLQFNFSSLFAPPSLPGDFNGDGLADLTLLYGPTSSQVWVSDTSFNFSLFATRTDIYPGGIAPSVADFDGDGCTDFYIYGSPETVSYSCAPAVATANGPTSTNTKVFGDFNGDGKTDILVLGTSGNSQLWLSTGTGFVEVNPSLPAGWGSTYRVVVGDWNGDGKADILLVSTVSGTSHKLYLSTGTDFTPALDGSGNPITIANTGSTTCATATSADWNNDGATDFWMQFCSLSGLSDTLYTFAYTPELMITVSNGIGSTTNVSYAPLNTNGSFYTKGSSAVFPNQDIDGALYVVSRVDASNGLGTCNPASSYTNCYSSTYAYAGAQTNVQGRGFLGFSSVTITDLQTNVVQTTNYSTTFPYIGMVTSQTKKYSTTTLNSTTNTLSNGTGCGSTVSPITNVYFDCLTQSVLSSNDLNGTAFPTTTTTYTYDSYGNALTVNVSVSDGSSKDTTNTYNNDTTNWYLGRLLTTSVDSIVGSSNLTRQSSFSYDSGTGLLTQEIIESGISTCNSGSSSCTVTTTYTYDPFGHRITTTISGTGITTRTSYAFYDSLGEFQTSAENALGQSESWAYDARFGLPTSHTGPNNLTTTWTYDTFGRQTLETRPDGTKTGTTSTGYAYCSGVNGGSAACPTYGAYLAQAEVFASDGVTQIGPISTTTYDMLSRAVANDTQGFDGSTIRVSTQYDSNGRVQQTSRPYFATAPPCAGSPCWTSYTYDSLGRVTQATFPDSSHTTYTFSGLTTTAENNLSQTTTTVKNAQGLNYQVTDPASHTTTYVYDAFGNVLTVTDPAGNVVTNTYDIRGNKVSSVDPDMGTWTYVHDVLGELTSQTNAKSQTTTLTYDVLGRALTRSEPSLYSSWTFGVSAQLHNVGQLIEAEACTASGCSTVVSDRTITYDGLGRPSQTVLNTGGSFYGYTTTYNSTNGKIASVEYPSEYILDYGYNSVGYLTQLTDASGAPIWTANTRDAELHLTSYTAGNGVLTNQSFSVFTGLPSATTAGAAGTVASLAYTFDTIGNLTARTDNDESYTERFCYDSLNRLTNYAIGATCTSTGTKTVAYDSVGNITSKSDTGTYTYPSSGSALPHAVSSITGTVDGLTNPKYSYDGDGNLTCTSSGTSCSGTIGRQVTVTAFNMAASVTQGSTSLSLTYDDQHQRVQQATTVSGTTTTTVYLNDPASGAMSQRVTVGSALPTFVDYVTVGGNIVAQRNVSYQSASAWGAVNWNAFSWGPPSGSLWGSTAGTNPPRFKWGTDPWSGLVVSWAYFTLDHLGSVAVITDQGGNVLQRLAYDPWGKQRNPNGTDASCGAITVSATTRGFTNQEQMPAACLVNLNARLYDPSIGKFMAADPVVGDLYVPNAFNRYAYVLNNPLSFTDPSGNNFFGSLFGAILDIGVFFIAPELEGFTLFGTATSGGLIATAATLNLESIGILAANGAIGGGIAAGVSGGNVLKGALFGGISAGVTFGVAPQLGLGGTITGELTEAGVGRVTSAIIGTAIAQGAVGGILSVAQGGNFGSGFLAAGIGSLAGPLGLSQGSQFSPGGLIESATLGGIGSALGGGKFANGAESAAFSYAAGASYGSGTGATNSNDPFAGLLDIAGKIWNLPNTAIGLTYGAAGYIAGWANYELGGQLSPPDILQGVNGLYFTNSPLQLSAMTIGNATVFGTGQNFQPTSLTPNYNLLGDEETQHTYQGELLGPLYLPAHILFGTAATIFNGGWHGPTNILESGPHSEIPQPWPH